MKNGSKRNFLCVPPTKIQKDATHNWPYARTRRPRWQLAASHHTELQTNRSHRLRDLAKAQFAVAAILATRGSSRLRNQTRWHINQRAIHPLVRPFEKPNRSVHGVQCRIFGACSVTSCDKVVFSTARPRRHGHDNKASTTRPRRQGLDIKTFDDFGDDGAHCGFANGAPSPREPADGAFPTSDAKSKRKPKKSRPCRRGLAVEAFPSRSFRRGSAPEFRLRKKQKKTSCLSLSAPKIFFPESRYSPNRGFFSSS